MTSLQRFGRRFRSPRIAPEKEDGSPGSGRRRGQRMDQVRAADPLGQRRALDRSGPQQRHAVGDPQIRLLDEPPDLRGAVDLTQDVEVDRDHPAAATRGKRIDHRRDRLTLVDDRERKPIEGDRAEGFRRPIVDRSRRGARRRRHHRLHAAPAATADGASWRDRSVSIEPGRLGSHRLAISASIDSAARILPRRSARH